MRRFLLVAMVALFAAPAAAQMRLAGAGDSITFGINSNVATGTVGGPNDGYFPWLSTWLNANAMPFTVFNRGVGGETTADGRLRMGAILSELSPNVVIIMYGTNDISNIIRLGTGEAGITAAVSNLDAMVSMCQGRGAQPILATILPRHGGAVDPNNALTRSLNRQIRNIAGARGIQLADVESRFFRNFEDYLYSDTIHPTVAGYQVMAEVIAASVARVAPETIDLVAPIPTFIDPLPNATNASPGAAIRIHFTDFGRGLDLASFSMMVNGAPVTPRTQGSPNDLDVDYAPSPPFSLGQTISVSASLRDQSMPPNVQTLNYSYRISGGNGTGGDIDRSGRVDGTDLVLLGLSFGSTLGQPRYRPEADIDSNGFIDGNDLAFVAAAFGSTL